MGSNTASIKIGIDGVNDIRSALRMLKSEFGGLEGTLKGIATGFVRLGADVAKAATGLKAIDFGAAADKYKQIDDQITRMAIRGGKSIEDLKAKFKDFGRQAGVGTGEFANAAKQFDRATFSGIDDAAEAMKNLGAYAEDTDRSLEEMVELGSDLYTKIGVPASRVEIELRKIQTIASNTGLASGFLGLEDSLRRLLPIAAKLQGGPSRAMATKATIQKQGGYSNEVSNELYERIFGSLSEEKTYLWRQAAASAGFKGDVVVQDPNTRRPMYSKGALKAVQKYTKGKPLYGVADYFGGGLMGEEAARAFRRLDLNQVDLEEDRATLVSDVEETQREQARQAAEEAAAFAAKGRSHEGIGGARGRITGAASALFGPAPQHSRYSRTEAGKRQRRELARQALETDIGKKLVGSQDRLAGKMTTAEAAAAGTVNAYMPGPVQDAVHVGAAALGNGREIAGALRDLKGSIDSLPGKVQSGVQKGVESAKPPPRVGIGDIFGEKNAARVN